MLTLVIGNKNLSSWSMRPWLLLRQSKIDFEEHVFLFEEADWRDRIVAFSPSRRVPALRHRLEDGSDLAIWDSFAICEYIAELYPDRKLWPEDRAARAFARTVSAEMHSSFANMRKDLSMDVTARYPRRTLSKETQGDVDRVISIWGECRSRFGAGGPFLFGKAFSIADAMFAPVVWRLRGYDIPIEPRSTKSEAREWYEMMLALESMRAWERDAKAEVDHAAATQKQSSSQSRLDPTSVQHCFAVIFSSKLKEGAKAAGYDEDVMRMEELAKNDPGFLGIESARGVDGFGVTVSYWDSLEAIARWRAHADHQKVQARGRKVFYERYEIRVCNVERGNKFRAE